MNDRKGPLDKEDNFTMIIIVRNKISVRRIRIGQLE